MRQVNGADHRSVWTHMMTVPFTQGYVDAGGVRTRYVAAGPDDAPALLMMHGTAGSWEGFCANIGEHAQHFHCVAYDMVGSGFTAHPDEDYEVARYVQHAHDLLQALGIDRAAVMGASLGAWVAARFAISHPGATIKLVLLSAAGLFANASNMARIRTVRSKAVDDPSWENIKPIFDHLLHAEESRIPDIIAVRQAVYRQPGMAETMRHILCLQDPDIRPRNLISEDEWRSITVPALVVGSLADKDEYLETARRVSRLMPNARYIEMADVGHWPQFEDPETFNPLSIRFLLEP